MTKAHAKILQTIAQVKKSTKYSLEAITAMDTDQKENIAKLDERMSSLEQYVEIGFLQSRNREAGLVADFAENSLNMEALAKQLEVTDESKMSAQTRRIQKALMKLLDPKSKELLDIAYAMKDKNEDSKNEIKLIKKQLDEKIDRGTFKNFLA